MSSGGRGRAVEGSADASRSYCAFDRHASCPATGVGVPALVGGSGSRRYSTPHFPPHAGHGALIFVALIFLLVSFCARVARVRKKCLLVINGKVSISTVAVAYPFDSPPRSLPLSRSMLSTAIGFQNPAEVQASCRGRQDECRAGAICVVIMLRAAVGAGGPPYAGPKFPFSDPYPRVIVLDLICYSL
jgi:hypothetical protein